MKVGDKLYHYDITRIWGNIEFSIYEIVGETPKFWKVKENDEEKELLCDKKRLVIRGRYRVLQERRNEKLDRELKLQKLISKIDRKTDFIMRNKRELYKKGNVEAFESLITALDNAIGEEGKSNE